MAFYGFQGDADRCYWTPYISTTDYGVAPISIQDSAYSKSGESQYNYSEHSFPESNLSVYTCPEPRTLQYHPFEYHHYQKYYPYTENPPQLSYGNPRFLQYEPLVSDRGYFPSETTFRVSYSVSEFNEPEFEEYDPTPYGGGYDIAITYGKPLPPSDIICYPRTLPKPDGPAVENLSYGSTPSLDDVPAKPPNGGKPVDTKPELGVEGKSVDVGVESPDVIQGYDSDGRNGTGDDDSDSQNGAGDDDSAGGMGVGYGYGNEADRPLSQIPYGSGLESLDLCESIFGYWPCLAAQERRELARRRRQEVCEQEGRMDPWRIAADYLFGSPVVYGDGYHRQQQCESWGNPWLQS